MIRSWIQSIGNFVSRLGRFRVRHQATCLVGLDIGTSAVTLVQLEKRGRKCSLKRFAIRRLARGVVQDGAILDRQKLLAELRDLVGEVRLSGRPVVLSVSGPSVMVKRVKVSGVPPRDLDQHLHWDGHRYISLPLDDVYLDHQVLGVGGEGELDLLLVVAKREAVEDRRSVAAEAGLEPVVCDVDGLALANMASLAGFNAYGSHLTVNLVSGGCTMVALDRGMPIFVRDVSWEDDFAGESTSIKRGRIHGGPAADEPGRLYEYADYVDVRIMAEEIRRNLNFMNEGESAKRVEHVLLSGDGVSQRLCENLAGELSTPVTLLNPFQMVGILDSHPNQDQVHRFGSLAGVAVGLAARSDCYA